MDIETPFRCLGPVAFGPLRDAILAQDESAWAEQRGRQLEYEVHRQTQSIVLIFTDGEGWPRVEIRKEPGWARLAPVAVPLMHDIIARTYPSGGTIIRAMAARLPAGMRIAPHRDAHASFHASHRIHVPITTNPRVRFTIDGRPYRMECGYAYEINNQKIHSVMNRGRGARITYIFDYLPRERLLERPAG